VSTVALAARCGPSRGGYNPNVTAPHWDERYEKTNVPWDTGVPDPLLIEFMQASSLTSGRVLEVGCGTGTNAIWLASRGFDVLGIDISPRAIAQAVAKVAGESVRFEVMDFFDPALTGSFELVFDRGVMHLFDDLPAQAKFAERVAELLSPTGVWLSIIGSTEGPARDHGPPRRSARDLVAAIEPLLEILDLRSTEFHANIPSKAAAWLLQARHRATPAQPSTYVGL
jgi:SAM-dependent methyltransferase